MISRDEYLKVLKRFKDKALIKVITGIEDVANLLYLKCFKII